MRTVPKRKVGAGLQRWGLCFANTGSPGSIEVPRENLERRLQIGDSRLGVLSKLCPKDVNVSKARDASKLQVATVDDIITESQPMSPRAGFTDPQLQGKEMLDVETSFKGKAPMSLETNIELTRFSIWDLR